MMDKLKSIADIRLLGGNASLDFVNTVDAWRDRWGPDFLVSYDDLVVWGLRVDLIDSREAECIRKLARADPTCANQALERAKALREALRVLFLADAGDRVPSKSAADELNTVVRRAAAHRAITYQSDGFFSWHWLDADLDSIVYRVAIAASELLTGHGSRRPVRECHGPNCGWLFLDSSRGGRRRWCSEETCGTHTRVLRFRGKQRGPA
jgi:predicted RNA-binding Zn ribbon-like protein